MSSVLWVWIVVAMAAYLYQFRDLVGPILEALGVS